AVVAFSAAEVYAVAELIRRQRGGAAVVLGALSPRTRNAQVALYQGGDVDYLVATDAIGMGLNLDVDHVAFAATRKFDGQVHRDLTPAELAQVAGRAGRHMNDGRFGVTGDVPPFEQDLIDRLETHTFDTVKMLQWRNRKLDCTSLDRLRESLREAPREARLVRARTADDVMALEIASADPEIVGLASGPAAIAKLWEVCQIPDYRKISTQNHAELVVTLYKFLMSGEERIPADWFAAQVELADRTDGDIDTLSNRLAHIRTWTFVSNRPDWLNDPEHWQGRARTIEDTLSDALHELLTQRFVDRRTSALMKGMRDKDELAAEIADDGSIRVESHYVGRLKGFRFSPDARTGDIHGKATRHAAAQVLAKELALRARRVAAAKPQAFKLKQHNRIVWQDEEIARLDRGDDPFKPQVVLLADEHLTGPERDKVQERLNTWVGDAVAERLKPLVEIAGAADVTGLARGIAFRLTENFGILKRESAAEEIRSLDQTARAQLRKYGVRFGAFNVYFPLLLKPANAELTLALWALKNAGGTGPSLEA
ncbi:MAG: helicase-related protein, partial [Hyphomicrobiaceae bacterium]